MDIHDFEGGFFVEGTGGLREPCHAQTLFQAACEADETITWRQEFYLSMYQFPTEFLEQVKETGKTAGYIGACWSRWLWFDIDRDGDLDTALEDTATLAEYLVWGRLLHANGLVEEWPHKDENAIFVPHSKFLSFWFSGKKGFHIGLPMAVFGDAASPSESFHDQVKAVVLEIARRAGVIIDTGVYDRVRLFRCPNTRHGKTDHYKIPLSYREIKEWEMTTILERAKRPRQLVDISSGEKLEGDDVKFSSDVSEMSAAAELWRSVVSNMKSADSGGEKKKDTDKQTASKATRYRQMQTLPESGESVPRLRRATLEFIRQGVEPGNRAVALFEAAADCTRCQWPAEGVFSVLMDVARNTGLSGYEAEKQIVDGINAGMKGVE